MKKILDSKFLFILALSIIVLIILGVGAFYLFDDSDAVFVKDGYVLNPLSAKSEKYFFGENTSYKENLNQMVVFDDVDRNEVKVLRDSFLHYMDGSLSFLKNGAILDLDSISGKDAVKFYNITNKSIMNKEGNGYVIETSGEDVELKNFIGRISDNKYIVVGSLEAKIPGNEKNISGNYFEIVYTDEGVVNIENKDIKYQVTAQGSYIYTGDIVIDLGDKKITKNKEDIMSITSITINGNENIDIIPKAPDDDAQSNGDGTGNDADENGGGGAGDNQGGNGEETNDIHEEIITDELQVLLDPDSVEIDSSSITVGFKVLNEREDDSLTLMVTDLSTGRTVDEVIDISNKGSIPITLLTPENKYLFTVLNERDGNKYFQKIFETNGFGISLEKTYVTSSQIGYKVKIDAGGNLQDARLTLKKYNESKEVNQLETVESYQLKDIIDMSEGEHDGIIFSNLDSNTIYTAVLDNFSVASTNFNDIYNITLTSMTLKKAPSLGNMQKEITNNNFKLYIDDVDDPDNAITKYKYRIYNVQDREFENQVIPEIVNTNASPVNVTIGKCDNCLDFGVNYVYKVVIEYFDNEKYIEDMFEGSINLFKGKEPYVVIEHNDKELSYDKFEAEIYLNDVSCVIDIPGKCNISNDAPNESIKVMLYEQGGLGERLLREYAGTDLVFEPTEDDGVYKATLPVNGLNYGTSYAIYVLAERNTDPTAGFQPLAGTYDNNVFKTKYLSSFEAEWEHEVGTKLVPIETKVKLKGIEKPNTIKPEETMNLIKAVVFSLYDGEFNNNLDNGQKFIARSQPIVKDGDNIINYFYNDGYPLTLKETFGLTKEELEQKTGNEDGLLSPYYTLVIDAYYDYEMTKSNSVNIVVDKAKTYSINPELRHILPNKPTITISKVIKKKKTDTIYDKSLSSNLVVGYSLNADFDEDGFAKAGMTPKKINYYVYNEKKEKTKFYVLEDGQLNLYESYSNDLEDRGYDLLDIYMGYGSTDDNVMIRGNNYYIGYEIIYDIKDEDGNIITAPPYPTNDNVNVPARFGVYESLNDLVTDEKDKSVKDKPKINYLYIDETTKDGNVTYKYELTDIDNSLVSVDSEKYLYYYINDEYNSDLKLSKTESIITDGLIQAEIPVYSGEITLSNLSKGDGYTLFYRCLLEENGKISENPIGDKNILYDGYYDLNDYNFKFEITPNLENDDMSKANKVVIKMLAEDEMLSRILNYRIKFEVIDFPDIEPIVKDVSQLKPCPDALDGNLPRCYEYDYFKLQAAHMKTEDVLKKIKVSIEAVYDNGLTGYGFEDKIGTDTDYRYMIMQENSTVDSFGRYRIIYGGQLDWFPSTHIAGYYKFNVTNKDKNNIEDRSFIYTKMYNPIDIDGDDYTFRMASHNGKGIGVSSGVLNPKMLSVADIKSDNNKNVFSFSSITPKIRESEPISLINGARLYLNLSGTFSEDVCSEGNGNSCNTRSDNKYLYIDIWDNESDATDNTKSPVDTVKIKLNNGDMINGLYDTSGEDGDKVVNLVNDRTYYYTVYLYLNNNGNKKKTRLFDESLVDKSKVYSFETKKVESLFNDLNVDVIPNKNEGHHYNDKLLDTTFSINKYSSTVDIPLYFNLSYVLCNIDDTSCDLNNNLIKKDINDKTIIKNSEATFNFEDFYDITSANLEFGKEYLMKFYATYKTYDVGKNIVDIEPVFVYEKVILGNRYLKTPEFKVARTADYINDSDINYVIDLDITCIDTDRVFNDGVYYVEVTDINGNPVGNLQLLDEDNIYTTIPNDEAIPAIYQRKIRISNLNTPDTLFIVKVYGDADINNANLENKTVRVVSGNEGKGHYVYSSNNYGVAFGEVNYTFAPSKDINAIVASFTSGSHLKDNDKLVDVTYTIYRKNSSISPYSNTLKFKDDINFQIYSGIDDAYLVFYIDEDEYPIDPGARYTFTTSYTVYDAENEQYKTIDSTINPKLSDDVLKPNPDMKIGNNN